MNMLKMLDEEILRLARFYSSVNGLGRSLKYSGSKNGNMNGRDLRKIRKAIGFAEYVRLASSRKSPYKLLWDISNDKEKKEIDRQLRENGVVDALYEDLIRINNTYHPAYIKYFGGEMYKADYFKKIFLSPTKMCDEDLKVNTFVELSNFAKSEIFGKEELKSLIKEAKSLIKNVETKES